MKYKTPLLLACVLLVPFIYLAGIWSSLPEQVPLHFDLAGNIDRYGTKNSLLVTTVVLSLVGLILYVLLANIHRLSKHAPVENKNRMQKIALAVLCFMILVQCWLLYITKTGAIAVSIKALLAAVFLLFAIIGNYMPNLKPNYFAGFRLPWTLNNADNWRKTHDVAGRLWFAGGLLCMLLWLLLPFKTALAATGAFFLIMLLVPAVYSYRLFKKAKQA